MEIIDFITEVLFVLILLTLSFLGLIKSIKDLGKDGKWSFILFCISFIAKVIVIMASIIVYFDIKNYISEYSVIKWQNIAFIFFLVLYSKILHKYFVPKLKLEFKM